MKNVEMILVTVTELEDVVRISEIEIRKENDERVYGQAVYDSFANLEKVKEYIAEFFDVSEDKIYVSTQIIVDKINDMFSKFKIASEARKQMILDREESSVTGAEAQMILSAKVCPSSFLYDHMGNPVISKGEVEGMRDFVENEGYVEYNARILLNRLTRLTHKDVEIDLTDMSVLSGETQSHVKFNIVLKMNKLDDGMSITRVITFKSGNDKKFIGELKKEISSKLNVIHSKNKINSNDLLEFLSFEKFNIK